MTKRESARQRINRFIFKKTIIVGLLGGVFWTLIWMLLHYFNLVDSKPFIMWEKLLGKAIFAHWYMKLVGILLNGFLSIILAAIYYVCFKKMKHWLMGVGFGVMIWMVGYLVFPIILFDHNLFHDNHPDKHVGLLSLLILYGLFIGYTISFDYHHLHNQYGSPPEGY